ncbi:MAG TPA: hypothetical protein VHL57_05690 [Flavobacteriales bacterium]|jgi:hypothetical protein|nr:hypothetical protein [Flavobacteriales bacterium]
MAKQASPKRRSSAKRPKRTIERESPDPIQTVPYPANATRLTAEVEMRGIALLVGRARYREKNGGPILWGPVILQNDDVRITRGQFELALEKVAGEAVSAQDGRRLLITFSLDNPGSTGVPCSITVRICAWKGQTRTVLAEDVVFDATVPKETHLEEYGFYQLEQQ